MRTKRCGKPTVANRKSFMGIPQFKADYVVGKNYEPGMLPFGGCVDSRGKIISAISKQEARYTTRRFKLR